MKEKVFLQTILERNPSNSFYIFLLDVDFENITVELHVLINVVNTVPYRPVRPEYTVPAGNPVRLPLCFVPVEIPAVPASYRPYRPISGNTGRYRAYRPVQKKVFFFFFFLSFVIFEFLLG